MRDNWKETLTSMALPVAGPDPTALNDQRAFHPDGFMRLAYILVGAVRKPPVDHQVVRLTFSHEVWPRCGAPEFGTRRLLGEVHVVHYACGLHETQGIAALRNSDSGLEGVGHCLPRLNKLHDDHV